MSTTKILWVQDEYDGPMNGLSEYQGEQLWFSRVGTPSIIVPIVSLPYTANTTEAPQLMRSYHLYRLNASDLELVTQNHQGCCEQTGAPFNHGDPVRIQRRTQSVRMKTETAQLLVPEDKQVIEAQPRALTQIRHYNHKISPEQIKGTYIVTIPESSFTNYHVPHTVECI